jgi:hypothetical protein
MATNTNGKHVISKELEEDPLCVKHARKFVQQLTLLEKLMQVLSLISNGPVVVEDVGEDVVEDVVEDVGEDVIPDHDA